jgi:general secretion pathway protein D
MEVVRIFLFPPRRPAGTVAAGRTFLYILAFQFVILIRSTAMERPPSPLIPFVAIALSLAAVAVRADVTVSPAALDAGVVAPGTARPMRLTLTNAGAAPVRLLAAEVSCPGCTKVEFVPATLAPGKAVELPVTFKPPADDAGRVRRSVTLKTDDPRQAEIVVPLNAFVTPVAGAWPPELAVTDPKPPGADVTVMFDLVNVSDTPLTPLYAVGPVDGPKLAVPHAPVPAGGTAKLTATWHLPAATGPVTGQLILYVDHPKLTHVTIPYQATVAAAPPAAAGAATRPGPAPTTGPAAIIPPPPSPGGPTTGGVMGDVAPAPTPAAAAAGPPPATITLDLKESLPLKDFVDIAAAQLKLNLIYDEAALNVPVSVRLAGPLPADALLPLLKTLLQAKGLALVQTDRPEFWRVVTSKEAQALAEPGRPAAAGGGGAEGQVVAEFFTPTGVDLETATGLLRGFVTPNVGQVTPVPAAKALIVTDYAGQVTRLRRLMDLVDRPRAPAGVAVVPLAAAEPGPLADRVTRLLGQIAKAEGRSAVENVFVSPADDAGGDRGGVLVVGPEADLPRVTALVRQFDTAPQLTRVDYPVPDGGRADALDTLRQVLGAAAGAAGPDGLPRVVTAPQRVSVAATEGQHRRLRELLAGAAGGVGGDGVQLRAYRIQNRDAAELYATLTRLVGDTRGLALAADGGARGAAAAGPTPPPGPPGVSQEGVTRVGNPPGAEGRAAAAGGAAPGAGPAANASGPVVPAGPSGSPGVTITIDQGTNTLLVAAPADAHRRLQALIAELDRRQAQVLLEVMLVSVADSDTFAAAVEAAVKASFAGSTVGIGTDAGIGGGDFVNGRTPKAGTGLNAAIFNPASFSVFLRALRQTNKARVTSVPQVLAVDNKPALLRSIQQEPFTSVNASTTVATTSFGGFAEAGTTLELTPHVAAGGYLNLEYRLEVSSFTGNSAAAGVPPPKRSDAVTSFVSVPDGSTVVVGGLRSSNASRTVAKVPGLGEIPILGWIGRNQSDTDSRAAFYVFVRPTILRAAAFDDLKAATAAPARAAGVGGPYPETALRFIRE